ncbi:hypothetical protein B0T18DRAFT_459371 [Schizothecium vesticola]|uniref:tyrosinase n=1 Tax=Schizothecium vesticola TaxID=314040 RepID=A0AA40F7I6_9PEZI|nr:hypothetical protein B0T18DRAFT_459371 [Schizothecium vesticola]
MFLPGLTVLLAVLAQLAQGQHVTGIQAGVNKQTGERPSRLDINKLSSQGGPAWDLFIQALAATQTAPESDWLSWHQIAGIHGLPFKPYNGVDQVPGGDDKAGYCPHGEITFVTWHRPYLVLLEQTMHAHAQAIASKYPAASSATYKSAAETLRLPYWDWASDPDSQLPPVTTQPTIKITTPTGPAEVHNPLYSYRFQTFPFTDPDFQDQPLSQFSETKRCVDGSESSDGVNHYDLIADRLSSSSPRIRSLLYSTFTQGPSFVAMASTGGAAFSLELPHNTVHQEVSGGPLSKTGHTKPVKWSAFDPIFWLLHANVDRHFAMWQAIYHENATFAHSARALAVFGTAPGQVTADSPLKPFRDEKGEFWTSKRVESTRVFGYTYPELNDWAVSKEELKKQVTAAVTKLYGPAVKAARKARSTAGRSRLVPRVDNGTASQATEYAVQIQVDRVDLAPFLPCAIEVSMDNVVAGEYTLLSMPVAGVGGAKLPLSVATNGTDGAASDVFKALVGRMSVVIRKGDGGGLVPPTEVPSLAIAIEGREVIKPAVDGAFPEFGPPTTWEVDVGEVLKE